MRTLLYLISIKEDKQLESLIDILKQNFWDSSHMTSKLDRWSCACRDALKKRKPARNRKLEEVRKWSEKLGLNFTCGVWGIEIREREWGLEIEDGGWGLESDRWRVSVEIGQMEGEGLRDGGWSGEGEGLRDGR